VRAVPKGDGRDLDGSTVGKRVSSSGRTGILLQVPTAVSKNSVTVSQEWPDCVCRAKRPKNASLLVRTEAETKSPTGNVVRHSYHSGTPPLKKAVD
jgi:hypothetical protein